MFIQLFDFEPNKQTTTDVTQMHVCLKAKHSGFMKHAPNKFI